MQKKIEAELFAFEIITSEFVALNCHQEEENTCLWHTVC